MAIRSSLYQMPDGKFGDQLPGRSVRRLALSVHQDASHVYSTFRITLAPHHVDSMISGSDLGGHSPVT